jgi:hypothetical protein
MVSSFEDIAFGFASGREATGGFGFVDIVEISIDLFYSWS